MNFTRGAGQLALRGLALGGLLLATQLSPIAAQNTGSPLAPEALRCPGRTLPDPASAWMFVWQWESPISYTFPGSAGDDGPYAVALDHSCNLYVADAQNKQVVKLGPDGTTLAHFPTPTGQPGESSSPRGVAVDAQGNIYVSDSPRNEVLQLGSDGHVAATWGACATPSAANKFCDPSQPGMFNDPEGIAVDGAGNVYVVEVAGHRIQKLSSQGKSIAVWEMDGRAPGSLWILGQPALDLAGDLWVPDEYNNRVLEFSPDGAVIGQFGGPDASGDPGKFHGPRGVAVDQAGDIYVSDRDNWRVQKLAPDGTMLDQWRNCLDAPTCQYPDAGSDLGQFNYARGMAVDGQGNLYVADTDNKRVERLIATPVPVPPPPSGN